MPAFLKCLRCERRHICNKSATFCDDCADLLLTSLGAQYLAGQTSLPPVPAEVKIETQLCRIANAMEAIVRVLPMTDPNKGSHGLYGT